MVHWYTEKREQLVKITFFFVFTISSLGSLVLSRFYRSKKYVRDIYQPDWKSEPSVGPGDPSARQSDRGTPYMSIEVVRVGSGWGSQVSGKIRKISMECLGPTPDPGGHPDLPIVVFSNPVDIYL